MHAPVADIVNAWIGRAIVRREDAALVSGKGQFIDDLNPAGCLHLKFLRSPHAAGFIRAIGTGAATAAPGVAAVLSAADIGELRRPLVNELFPGMRLPHFAPFARYAVEAVGQPIAAVIAATAAQAEDALELIDVDIEPQSVPARDAREPCFEHRWRSGDVERAFATATHIARARIEHARVAPMALEPRGTLASWDKATSVLQVWLPTQAPHRARIELAAILGLAEHSVRVIAPDVGGAFGGKASIYPEDIIVALASLRLACPVKWMSTRSEDFLAATHGRGGWSKANWPFRPTAK